MMIMRVFEIFHYKLLRIDLRKEIQQMPSHLNERHEKLKRIGIRSGKLPEARTSPMTREKWYWNHLFGEKERCALKSLSQLQHEKNRQQFAIPAGTLRAASGSRF